MDNPVPAWFSAGRVRRMLRALATALTALLLVTCSENPIGPRNGHSSVLRLAPGFDSYARIAPLTLDQVHIQVADAATEALLLDVTRGFSGNQVTLSEQVPLTAARQDVVVTLELLSGQTLLFSGSSPLTLQQGTATAPTTIPVSYSGPGSNATALLLAPRDTIVRPGAVFAFRASASDAQQNPVASFYLSWSLPGAPAGAAIDFAGVFTAPIVRDTLRVKAVMPNGVADSTRVIILPAPAALTVTGGNNQTGVAGTRLAQPLAVQVNGADQLPLPGVSVSFAAASGGGSVDSATATTDAQGIARTGATLGATVGAQSFTASSAGLAAATFSATATAPGTALTWTGAVSTDWSAAANWTPARVPTSADDVVIPAGTPNAPTVTASCSARTLTVNATAVLTLGAFNCQVGGNVFADGSIAGTGAVQIATAAQIRGALPGLIVSGPVSLAGNVTTSGSVTVSNGDVTLAGHTLVIMGGLTTQGTGTLTMTSATEQVTVVGNAAFTGGSTTGKLTAGKIVFEGPVFSQSGATTSYAPSGSHQSIFTNSLGTITFADPVNSGFQDLNITATTATLQSDIRANGTLIAGAGAGPATITMSTPHTVTVGGVNVGNLVVNRAPLFIGAGPLVQFDNVQFTNSPTTAPQLTIANPGAATPFTFTNLNFGTTPVAPNGFYLDVTDTDGAASGVLTINLVTPTPATPGGFVRTTNGAVVNWPAAAPAAVWTGAVSTDWSVAGNWSTAQVPTTTDSAVIGTAANQPSLSAVTTVGAVSIISGGKLTINGQSLGVLRGLSTSGTGVLTMQNPADAVSVIGNAVFDGGDETGLLTEGGISVSGNFTQLATTSGSSYRSSGAHATALAGASPTVSFATPGTGAGTSGFQDLAWVGTGTLTLATPVVAQGTMVISSGTTSTITSANGSRLTAANLAAVNPLVFNNVPLTLNETTTTALALNAVTFQNMATDVSQLVVNHPGGGQTFTFTGLTFSTVPVAPNGWYLDATDNTGPADGVFTIDMAGATPATGTPFVRTAGGAVVNWPPAAPINSWTGTVSNLWDVAGNWSLGVVPSATDSVVIPAQAIQPVLNAATSVGAVVVSGGTLTLNGQTLTVSRTFATSGTGTLTSNTAGSLLVVAGNAVFAGGDETGLLTDGNLRVAGNFTEGTTANSFVASGLHTTFFNGTGAQTVTVPNGGAASSRFQNLRVINATGIVTVSGTTPELVVNGVLNVTNGATLTGATAVTAASVATTAGSTLSVFLLTVPAGGLSVAGNYGVNLTVLTGGGTVPALTYTNLRLTGAAAYALGADLATGGYLDLQSELAVAGHTVAVAGDFTTTGTGTLTMTNAADLVTVAGATSFYGGDETGKLTAGILRTSNQFLQDATNSTASFVASGNHTVEIISQNASGGTLSLASPTVSHFQNLRVLFLSTLTSDAVVNGNMEVNFNAAANFFAKRVTVGGSFIKAGTGFFGPTRLTLLGTNAVTGGTLGPDTLEFAGATPQSYPDINFTFPKYVLVANDLTAATGAANIANDLEIRGNGIFRMGTAGNTFNVGGSLRTVGSGQLQMIDPAATVNVTGDASFAGGSTSGLLTAGTLSIGGNFLQSAITNTLSYAPSGTHKTVFVNTATKAISMGSPGLGANGSHFQVLDVSGATGGLTLDVNLQADSIISTSAAAKISSPGVTLTVRRSQVSGLSLVSTTFSLDELGTFSTENFSNVTFSGFPTSGGVTMLIVSGPGSSVAARPAVTTNNVNFQTLPVGAGNFYVDLTSTNSAAFNLNMTTSNQATNNGGNGALLYKVTPATGVATVTW